MGTEGQQAVGKYSFLESPGSSMDWIVTNHSRVVDCLTNMNWILRFRLGEFDIVADQSVL
jgi:hypothetical protein